eukprot:TRINITY_DN6346_c0_g1_i2.p1 TRINITY_DN6346_c0_g1~~TRINITY_DN6346_c0_g1_i2.p1  ORF type:complete len:239 (-),score=33.07 TRINITY_DN6346_c0_g1_i2:556-1272(-)
MEESGFAGLSDRTLREIENQFTRLFKELNVKKQVLKIELNGIYFLLERIKFALAFFYRELLEEPEEKSVEVWKKMKMLSTLNHPSESLTNLLSNYLQTLPNTFSVENKKKLVPVTTQLIRDLILNISDTDIKSFNQSDEFKEWIKNYYSFVEDGQIYSGFRGKSLSGEQNVIYIHKDAYWNNVDQFGEEKAIKYHCHTVIHEIMHLHSFNGEGVNTWDKLGTLMDGNGRLSSPRKFNL